ncbi:TIGR02444 family protein [Zhongshania sp. BJYM1]|uniref:TIGR02444 family protein n=1 Tax=Zhongshania aquatica TaxID=2965069 RepID=UPI0022B4A815|nr:TIGR02444 family protein [Marortus sp. BJYM1]
MNEKFSAGGNSPKQTLSTLWEFALAAYAAPIIQRHCLYLQDHYQMDVNMLLAAGFCGRNGLMWTEPFCRILINIAAPIREQYILPIRALRLEAYGSDGLYTALKKAEIEAERIEISSLAAELAKQVAGDVDRTDVANNLLVYAALEVDINQANLQLMLAELAAKFLEIS